jgi:hypothetical protein
MVTPNIDFSVTSLLKACQNVKAKVVVHNMQKAQHYITAETSAQEDTDEIISLIESFYTINSIEIDTTELKVREENYAFNFEDEKLNQQFTILADAVTECLNNGIAANGYILSAIQNIHSKLQLTPIIDYEIGDIVDANFGTNMPYETSGGHIWNLVIAKKNHLAFVVPMFKNNSEMQNSIDDTMQISENQVSFYNIKSDLSATVLALGAGRWISSNRISKVIGKASADYLQKVITTLPKSFDFTSKEERLSIKECVEPLEREHCML